MFLDGLAARRARTDMVLSAAVSSGVVTAVQAWPEFFPGAGSDEGAFPSRDADMSAFELENATPESFAADMAALVEASRQVVIRDPSPEPEPPVHRYVPDAEWV